ncbi:MAG: alcohol dehydrogenase catalytic domain-containing protein [Clostridiales Family XIII bacterium]|nr:alcohol dehydrogenase catalytic domain-containing protein [Clostridiales Family XIII bacterium]
MKYAMITGARRIEIRKTEPMPAAAGKARIRIKRCGICGTDFHMWEDGETYKGLIPGHEAAGVIEEIPSGYDGPLKEGDRVAVFPAEPCGDCQLCRTGLRNLCLPPGSMGLGCGLHEPGAFSECLDFSIRFLSKLPDNVTYSQGSLAEPASVAYRAIQHADLNVGDGVLISGAGIIGLLCAQFAKLSGAAYIAVFDIEHERLKLAYDLGDVTESFDVSSNQHPEKTLWTASNGGFDCFIDCTGHQNAINLGISVLKKGKKMVCVGINFEKQLLDHVRIVQNELEVKGSFGQVEKDFDECIKMIGAGILDVDKYISKTIGFSELQSCFEQKDRQKGTDLKVLLDPEKD